NEVKKELRLLRNLELGLTSQPRMSDGLGNVQSKIGLLTATFDRLGQVKTDDDFNGVLKDVTDKVSESHKRAELNAVLKEIKKSDVSVSMATVTFLVTVVMRTGKYTRMALALN
ncbi:unnamed protein product, partial [Durusdinium trenchii]